MIDFFFLTYAQRRSIRRAIYTIGRNYLHVPRLNFHSHFSTNSIGVPALSNFVLKARQGSWSRNIADMFDVAKVV